MKKLARMNFAERITRIAHSSDPDACWDWPGRLHDGYGSITAKLDARGWRTWGAHRAAYTVLVGPVDPALELDHLCRNRACMNPRHLEPVTPRENTMRSSAPTARNAAKTHCIHGHALTPENIWPKPSKYGPGRSCAACHHARQTRYRRARGDVEKGSATHCKHGHEFTPENTRIRKTGNKTCITCARNRTREWMAKQRATPEGKRKQDEVMHRYRQRRSA